MSATDQSCNCGRCWAHHGQQLSEVVVLDDALHVWGALRVCSMPKLIYSPNLSTLAPLTSSKRDSGACCISFQPLVPCSMEAYLDPHLSSVVDQCRTDFAP